MSPAPERLLTTPELPRNSGIKGPCLHILLCAQGPQALLATPIVPMWFTIKRPWSAHHNASVALLRPPVSWVGSPGPWLKPAALMPGGLSKKTNKKTKQAKRTDARAVAGRPKSPPWQVRFTAQDPGPAVTFDLACVDGPSSAPSKRRPDAGLTWGRMSIGAKRPK
jgi:hypothetical protein